MCPSGVMDIWTDMVDYSMTVLSPPPIGRTTHSFRLAVVHIDKCIALDRLSTAVAVTWRDAC
eukprot:40115-Eustigmatos_ZCMA.PRE.1